MYHQAQPILSYDEAGLQHGDVANFVTQGMGAAGITASGYQLASLTQAMMYEFGGIADQQEAGQIRL